MNAIEEQSFCVVQIEASFRNEIGEMTGLEVYAHVRTRLGGDAEAAETVLRDLKEKGEAMVGFKNSLGRETVIEIRRTAEK